MFQNILGILKGLLNNTTILTIIAAGLFTLLIDGKKYKEKGYVREFKVIQIISYSYMVLGGLMYILFLFI